MSGMEVGESVGFLDNDKARMSWGGKGYNVSWGSSHEGSVPEGSQEGRQDICSLGKSKKK